MAELNALIAECGDDPDPVDPLFDEKPVVYNPPSPRERIRELKLAGAKPGDIARAVGITASTVRGHLVRLGLAKSRKKPVLVLTLSEKRRRAAMARKTHGCGRNGGRHRDPHARRCACGRFTKSSAERMRHRCSVQNNPASSLVELMLRFWWDATQSSKNGLV